MEQKKQRLHQRRTSKFIGIRAMVKDLIRRNEAAPAGYKTYTKAEILEAFWDILTQPVEAFPEKGTKKPEIVKKKYVALAILCEHPDWSNTRIAKETGVNRTTLYTFPEVVMARNLLKQGRDNIPRGTKNGKTGDVESWEADTFDDHENL